MLPLPTFLPGQLILSRGTSGDYRELECFHYLTKRPATWAAVWSIRYLPRNCPTPESNSRLAAVGVLSYPVPSCRPRERVLDRLNFTRAQNLAFANQQVRTISRVVVHPQFRSLGLSTILVQCLCDNCDTRYVEAIAMMARAHPFFDRAGMTRIAPERDDEPVYFILDRAGLSPSSGTPGEGWGGGDESERAADSSIIIHHFLQTPTLALPRSTGGGDRSGASI